MTIFAFTRSEPINSYKRLRDLERHALRADQLARDNLRDGAAAGAGLDWPDKDARRLSKAYGSFKKRNNADPRKGSQLLHSVGVGVSPRWIEETGGLHDPANPRNILLFETSIAWVKSFAGDDAIVSARMDLDENGGGWVDIYFAPIRQQKYKGKTATKAVISVNKCLEEHALQHGYSKGSHYTALNTGWAKYAQQHLDPALERGIPGRFTGREHLPPRLFKAEQDAIKQETAVTDLRQTLEDKTIALEVERAELKASHDETTHTLLGIFTDPHFAELAPNPAARTLRASSTILEKLSKLGSLKGPIVNILYAFAIKLADLRETLETVARGRKRLDQAIDDLTKVQHRLTAEDLQTLENAQDVATDLDQIGSIDPPAPW